MRIKWFGHSAFAITSLPGRQTGSSGKTILTDPYEPGGYNGAVGYKPIVFKPDIVTLSHNHPDHNYTKPFSKATIIAEKGDYNVAEIKITGIPAWHDPNQGAQRGNNLIFVLEIDGLRIAHCGDLGHTLPDKDVAALGKIDILLIPVGGYFTIDATQATTVLEKVKPKIVIPMHYKTEVLDFPIAGVDEFLSGKKNIKRITDSDVSVAKETLPSETEIWVLPYH
ncbi:MAG: MBL fold metallo-hydrolase [Planctomycetota bacterium]